MACGATLKRTHEFDPLHSPHSSPKRRRCSPMTLMASTPPPQKSTMHDNPFGEVSPKITAERIYASIGLEFRRMQKRRQLIFASGGGSTHGQGCYSGDVSPPPNSTQTSVLPNSLSPSKQDMPLFTFKQVGLICERLLKDREKIIGEQYNKILTEKLAEQYEAFLKFNHDQLNRRFNNAESTYVS